MKSTIKEKKENKVTLEVEIESEAVDRKLDQIYQKVVQEMDLPGFRKGKVPKSFLKARFGDDVFYEDAQEELVEEYLPQALEESDVDAVSKPEVETQSFERGEDFVFEAEVEVMPEAKLGDYKGLEIEAVEEVEVTEEDIQRELDGLQEQNAQIVPKEGDLVEEEDIVIVRDEDDNTNRFSASEDPQDPTHRLVGRKVGEEVELDSEGEKYRFTIEEIKEVDLPELDDEFALDLGHESMEQLRENVRADLSEEMEEEHRQDLGEKLLDKVVENSDVSPPEGVVEGMVDDRIQDFESQLGPGSIDALLQKEDRTEEALREELGESARQNLKRQLVSDKIAELEGIEVDDEQLEEALEEEAERQDTSVMKLRNQLKAQDQLEAYRDGLKRKKVQDLLLETAQISYVSEAEKAGKESDSSTEQREKAEQEGETNE